jgi:hypothetical protein
LQQDNEVAAKLVKEQTLKAQADKVASETKISFSANNS